MQALQKGDVLLEFNGVPIANDGTVVFRHRERMFFSYLVTLKPTGCQCSLKVLRDGEIQDFNVDLQPMDALVPVQLYDHMPSYYMFGGLVFMPLSQPYLHEYGEEWPNTCPRRLYDKALNSLMKQPEQQIVFLSQVTAVIA